MPNQIETSDEENSRLLDQLATAESTWKKGVEPGHQEVARSQFVRALKEFQAFTFRLKRDQEERRPSMIYWTLPNGIICRAEAKNSDSVSACDGAFAAPFTSNKIVGSDLFEFIEGIEVRYIYRALAASVLESGQTITFDYRCDSRAIRRDMRMQLSRDAGMVRYESVLIRETPHEDEIPLDQPGADVFVAICSFCKDYRFPINSKFWKRLEDLMGETELPSHFSFSHGICEECYGSRMSEFEF